MLRCRVFALVAAVGMLGPLGAVAALADQPSTNSSGFRMMSNDDVQASPLKLRNAGAIDGQIVSVDYKSGIVTLQPAKGKTIDVKVLPSTTILPSTGTQADKASFRTIADLAKGAKVQVMMSQLGSQYIAQIITLK